MTTIQITKNNIEFEINLSTDIYGKHSVTARQGENTAKGKIPGAADRIYPRIEFLFTNAQWLIDAADRRSTTVGDFETMADAAKRRANCCEFILTAEEVELIGNSRY